MSEDCFWRGMEERTTFVATPYGMASRRSALVAHAACRSSIEPSPFLIPNLLGRTLALLRADVAALSLYDDGFSTARLFAIATADGGVPSAFMARLCVPPENLRFFARLGDTGPWVVGTRVPHAERANLALRILIAVLFSEQRELGCLIVIRKSDVPFTAYERTLGRCAATRAGLAVTSMGVA